VSTLTLPATNPGYATNKACSPGQTDVIERARQNRGACGLSRVGVIVPAESEEAELQSVPLAFVQPVPDCQSTSGASSAVDTLISKQDLGPGWPRIPAWSRGFRWGSW